MSVLLDTVGNLKGDFCTKRQYYCYSQRLQGPYLRIKDLSRHSRKNKSLTRILASSTRWVSEADFMRGRVKKKENWIMEDVNFGRKVGPHGVRLKVGYTFTTISCVLTIGLSVPRSSKQKEEKRKPSACQIAKFLNQTECIQKLH